MKAWREGISERPGVKRGIRVPVSYPFMDAKVLDPKKRGMYEAIEKMGIESGKRELGELVKDRRAGGGKL